MDPALAWGLAVRGIGLVYLVSYASLFFEVLPHAGLQGVAPIRELLACIKRDLGARRFWYFPSLLWWFGPSDGVLRGLVVVGWLSAAALIVGGPWSPWALLLCYLIYLSLDRAVALNFPWESLLFEMSLLGLFVPATHVLLDLRATAPPPPAIAWAFHLLLFRLMFGFGKQKFIGSTLRDTAYLKGFLVWQPLPSKVGWYIQHLPLWMLRGASLFLFLVEVPAPWLLFFPGDASVVAAVLTGTLMVGIALCGTYGYFSLAGLVACLPILDPVTPHALSVARLAEQPLVTSFVALHTLGALLQFPANSWITQTWMYNPVFLRFSPWLTAPLRFYRSFQQFRLVHPYGVFQPKCGATARFAPVVEASWDGESWQECEYRFGPSNPHTEPRFLAPHHPRGDQAVTYESVGAGGASLGHSTFGLGNPYDFTFKSGAPALVQRILEGSPSVRHYFRRGALRPELGPPLLVRITNHMLEPVSLAEHRRTGAWWRRTYVGPHLPPTTHDPAFWRDRLPEPELWHWDDVIWHGRSRLAPMLARARVGEPPGALVTFDGQLIDAEVSSFWQEFLPNLGSDLQASWSHVADAAVAVRSAYSPDQLRRFERVFGRLHLILLARLSPFWVGRGLSPPIPAHNYFELAMLAQYFVARGEEAYARAYAHPESAVEAMPSLNFESGLCLLGIFRHEAFVFEAQKLRLLRDTLWMPLLEGDDTRDDRSTRALEALSSYVMVMPFLVEQYRGAQFEAGFPERYPLFERRSSGEVLQRETDTEQRAARSGD